MPVRTDHNLPALMATQRSMKCVFGSSACCSSKSPCRFYNSTASMRKFSRTSFSKFSFCNTGTKPLPSAKCRRQ